MKTERLYKPSAISFQLSALVLSLMLTALSSQLAAQNLSINRDGALPDPSAMLDVSDTASGFLMPRMTTAQMNNISNPAEGLMIYNLTDSSIYFFDGASWIEAISDSSSNSGGVAVNSSGDFLEYTVTSPQRAISLDLSSFNSGGVVISISGRSLKNSSSTASLLRFNNDSSSVYSSSIQGRTASGSYQGIIGDGADNSSIRTIEIPGTSAPANHLAFMNIYVHSIGGSNYKMISGTGFSSYGNGDSEQLSYYLGGSYESNSDLNSVQLIISSSKWAVGTTVRIYPMGGGGSGSSSISSSGESGIAFLKDIKAMSSNGGTFTAGSWQTRDLNTHSGDTSFLSLNSNQFTLEEGVYDIEAFAPACQVRGHKARLQNVTDGVAVSLGTVEYSNNSSGHPTTWSKISDVFEVSGQKTFEIQHMALQTKSTNGFGCGGGTDSLEVYTTVKITKIDEVYGGGSSGYSSSSSSISSEDLSWNYAGSSSYDILSLEGAPIGTYITFEWNSSNVQSQTNAAPTQSSSSISDHGFRVLARDRTVASGSAEPAGFAVQIGKNLSGVNINAFADPNNDTLVSLDLVTNTATESYGAWHGYNPETGILSIDAGDVHSSNLTGDHRFRTINPKGSSVDYAYIRFSDAGSSGSSNSTSVSSIPALDSVLATGSDANGDSILNLSLLQSDSIQASSLNINSAYTLPDIDGTNDQVLQTDGSGNVTWETISNNAKGIDSVLTAGDNAQGLDIRNSGSIGIGVEFPTYPLEIQADVINAGSILRVKDTTGVNAWHLRLQGTNFQDLGFTETGVADNRLVLEAGGNVGIGEDDPNYLLDVDGSFSANSINVNDAFTLPTSDGSNDQVLQTDGSGNVTWETISGDGNGIYDGSGSISGNTTVTLGSNELNFSSSATDGFSVDGSTFSVDASNNRVGIGTTTPDYTLDVSGDLLLSNSGSNGLIMTDNSFIGNGFSQFIYDTDVLGSGSPSFEMIFQPRTNSNSGTAQIGSILMQKYANEHAGYMAFSTRGDAGFQEVMRIDSGGYIGIATNSPDSLLDVAGGARVQGLNINSAYSLPNVDGSNQQVLQTDGSGNVTWEDATGDDLGDHTATQNIELDGNYISNDGGNEGIGIDNDGKVGIGTNAPSELLDVRGDAIFRRPSVSTIGIRHTAYSGGPSYLTQTEIFSGSNSLTMNVKQYSVGALIHATDKLNIQSDKVAISTSASSNPDSLLDVFGGARIERLNINSAYTFPVADGTSGQVLKTDGSGNISFGGVPWTRALPDTVGIHLMTANLVTDGNWINGDEDDEGIYINNSGRVGIGETSPQGSLDVVDKAVIGDISLGSQSTDQGASSQVAKGYLTTPWIYTTAIEAHGERGGQGTSIIVGNDGNYSADDEIHFITKGESQLMINIDGEVGIGTDDPKAPLEIVQAAGDVGMIITEDAEIGIYDGTDFEIVHVNTSGAITDRRFIINTAGQVGIGDNVSPNAMLTIKDDGGDLNSGLQIQNSTNDDWYMYQNTSNELVFRDDGTDRLIVDASGNLTPGSDNVYDLGASSRRWDDIYATNALINTSDLRFKKNIENLDYGLDEVLSMRAVRYEWKDDPDKEQKVGFIAQELQEIIPEVVNVGDDSLQTLGIRYTELIPVLVNATQEQQQEIEELKAQNAEMQAKLNEIILLLQNQGISTPNNIQASSKP